MPTLHTVWGDAVSAEVPCEGLYIATLNCTRWRADGLLG